MLQRSPESSVVEESALVEATAHCEQLLLSSHLRARLFIRSGTISSMPPPRSGLESKAAVSDCALELSSQTTYRSQRTPRSGATSECGSDREAGKELSHGKRQVI